MINKPEEGNLIVCSCGFAIGHLVQVNGSLWLNVGGADLSYGHGRCNHCFKIWHFDSGDIKLQRLVNRIINS